MRSGSVLIILLSLIGFIGFIAGLQGNTLLLLTSLLFLISIGLAYLWNKYAFSKLRIERNLSNGKIEFGQQVYYQIDIVNRKMLPVFWLKVEDKITDGIDFVNSKVLKKSYRGYHTFSDLFSLRWYEWARRTYEILPRQRGIYHFGQGSLHYADLFSVFENHNYNVLKTKQLVVYPRVVPIKAFGIDFSQMFGSKSKDGWIFTDPLNKVGTRPYQSTDSIKQINWKASARHQQLQSDIYKPSFDNEVHIFLDKPNNWTWWDENERNALELEIVLTASLVDKFTSRGYKINLYSNIVSQNATFGTYTSIKPNNNFGQRDILLTALALLRTFSLGEISNILEREKKTIQTGATVIVITPMLSDLLKRSLLNYNRYYNLTVIRLVNNLVDERLSRVREYFIDGRDKWDEIETLEFIN